jgi:hypothetical protein
MKNYLSNIFIINYEIELFLNLFRVNYLYQLIQIYNLIFYLTKNENYWLF